MKNMLEELLNKIKYKYLYCVILILVIYILLGCVSYDLLNDIRKDTSILVDNNQISISDGIYVNKNGEYISSKDIIKNFSDNSYYDKIARKLIITTYDKVVKLKDQQEGMIIKDNTNWYNISNIASSLSFQTNYNKKLNTIYIYKDEYITAKLKYNRTNIYSVTENSILCVANSEDLIQVKVNNSNSDNNVWAEIKIVVEGDVYFGRVLKTDLIYEYSSKPVEQEELKKFVMVCAGDKVNNNTDLSKINAISFDSLRLASNKLLVEENTLPKNLGKNVSIYASITNGYKLANFDVDILSSMLNSDTNKENIIKQITTYVNEKNISGVVIDFKDFKSTDNLLFIQFIRELSANLHNINKKIIINVTNNLSIDIIGISKVADYVIVQAYGTRTLSSKTSGSHSTVHYVEKTLKDIIQSGVKVDKIILEIAPYSILWTERGGTVINSEIYYMNAADEYVKNNRIDVTIDKVSGQHFFKYTRGIITYKMWLEDEYSVEQKLKVADSIGIAGVSIYKSGLENKNIYDIINKYIEVK